MAKEYKPTLFGKVGNKLLVALVRRGLKIGLIWLLTVKGRKSGQPRTTPVAVVERDGVRFLVAAYGVVNWVLNIRAVGQGTLTRGGRSEEIVAVELTPEEAAPILKETFATSPSFVRAYWNVTPESPLEDFEREAVRHPVFLVKAAAAEEDSAQVA
jgi:deazaflavin-dependent oxidoreductase (nitroreductase family)